MSLKTVFRLLRRHWLLLLLVPLVLGASTYYFTRHEKKVFSSETIIYTGVASGYSIEGSAEPNSFGSNNASDNLLSLLNSRDTKEEALLRLLATHLLLPTPDPTVLDEADWRRLREVVPTSLRQQLLGPNPDSTRRRVVAFARANDQNLLAQLLNSSDPIYSLNALNQLKAARVGASDLLKVSYEAPDAGVARQTLALVVQVFMERNQRLHTGQTSSVIRYYEAAANRARQRLDRAEQRFLAFSRANRIINFEEQTKEIATAKGTLAADYSQVEMQYAGAVSALKSVNQQLVGRGTALRSSTQLLEQRRQLGRIKAEITDLELFARQNEQGAASPRLAQLRAEAEIAANAIQGSVNSYYEQTASVEGIPSKPLLDEWVKNSVLVEETKARLAVMGQRRADFEQEYTRLAPLGAALKGIEREIALAEKDYLALLAKLDDSKASQQNNEQTPTLRVVDPPFLPAKPQGSKRLLLVVLGALGGLACTAAGILTVGLLDKSLRAPGVAALRTGLRVGGVWPAGGERQPVPTAYQQRATEYLARHVMLQAAAMSHPAPLVVGILSTRRQQGKTAVCLALAQHCADLGLHTLALSPHPDCAANNSVITNAPVTLARVSYPAELAAVQGWSLATLIAPQVPNQYQLALLEMPSLLEDTYPVALLAQLDLVLLTVQAQETWTNTDQQAVDDLRAIIKVPVEMVLLGVPPDECEDLLGKMTLSSSKVPAT